MHQLFDVRGMTCQHCVRTVQEAVESLDAQARVAADLATGRVEIDSAQPREALAAAIVEAGYEVK